jgi:hypothetical protein
MPDVLSMLNQRLAQRFGHGWLCGEAVDLRGDGVGKAGAVLGKVLGDQGEQDLVGSGLHGGLLFDGCMLAGLYWAGE